VPVLLSKDGLWVTGDNQQDEVKEQDRWLNFNPKYLVFYAIGAPQPLLI